MVGRRSDNETRTRTIAANMQGKWADLRKLAGKVLGGKGEMANKHGRKKSSTGGGEVENFRK